MIQEELSCVPTGNSYLAAKDIDASLDPAIVWRNVWALFVMTPGYLLIAFFVLRSLKKSG